jgi:hypothetical protein
MNRFSALAGATFLSAVMPCTTAAQAMEIRQLDRGQGAYVGLPVQVAEKVSNDVTDVASTKSASKPMVTQNPDGTITVQKEPPKGDAKDAKVKKGLVIPAQVVAPTVPTPEKKR